MELRTALLVVLPDDGCRPRSAATAAVAPAIPPVKEKALRTSALKAWRPPPLVGVSGATSDSEARSASCRIATCTSAWRATPSLTRWVGPELTPRSPLPLPADQPRGSKPDKKTAARGGITRPAAAADSAVAAEEASVLVVGDEGWEVVAAAGLKQQIARSSGSR